MAVPHQLLLLHQHETPSDLSIALVSQLDLMLNTHRISADTPFPQTEAALIVFEADPAHPLTPKQSPYTQIPTLVLSPSLASDYLNQLHRQFKIWGVFHPEHITPEVLTPLLNNWLNCLQPKPQSKTALKASFDKLQEIDRLKMDFLSNISHELQSPLTPLEGYIELFLNQEFGDLSEEALEVLQIMQTCTLRLRGQIQNLLLLSYLSQENTTPDPDIFHFPDFLRNLQSMCQFQLQQKSQQLVLDTELHNGYVSADIRQISQVLMVLLDNALKFGPENSQITVRSHNISTQALRTMVETPPHPHQVIISYLPELLDPAGLYLLLEISDQGPGIPEDRLQRIFDFFYQVDSSSTREFGGVGVGLSIAKKILAAHESILFLESQPQQGTRVGFCLPVVTQPL